MTDETVDFALTRALEAILFAADAPLSLTEITRHVGERGDLLPTLRALAASYEPRGINLVERGGKWQFQTAPDLGHFLRTSRETVKKLSRAGVETLAVIAYHEPVTRPEIEEIRGVAVSGGTIDVLMEAGWVRPAGRRETPGRPLQYATTPEFLAHFNLTSRRDLPGMADLKAAGLLDKEPPRELALPLGGSESD